MIRLSWSTFRDRWQLFVGATVAVALGVALVQASLLTMISAASPTIPLGLSARDELVLRDAYTGAVSLSGIMMGVSIFVAVFVVGSTFAFTVAQRRQDLALLRLVGAKPRQVRRLLMGEALLLGTLGTILGVLLGVLVARFETWMFARFEFVPDGFTARWRWWIVSVSAAVGIGVAVLGCLSASRRASRVRALDALRDVGVADRVMTPSRWIIGLVAAAGAVVLMIATAISPGESAMDSAIPICLVSVVALSALCPVVVPPIGGLLDAASRALFPRSRLAELVHANLRDGVRRTSSTAAPIILLVGLVVGLAGSIDVIDAGRREEAARTVVGDLVVTTNQPMRRQMDAIGDVRAISEEVPVLVEARVVDSDGAASYEAVEAVAVGAEGYPQIHRLHDVEGELAQLHGDTIAVDRAFASRLRADVGDTAGVRIDGVSRDLTIVAVLSNTMTGPDVLLPLELAPAASDARRFIVQMDHPDRASLAASLTTRGSRPGSEPDVEVSDLDVWVDGAIGNQRQVSQDVLLAILGLATVYIVIAVINTVVIAGADRREEFAIARLTGLTRAQVTLTAVWESLAVVTVGAVLGAAAATTTLIGVAAGVSDVVGARVISIPWTLLVATIAGALLVATGSGALTAWAATSEPAIKVAGARQ